MDYKEPKTRQEKKNYTKNNPNIYNTKTIRLKEAIIKKNIKH